jgi:hypothetical protein
MSQNCTGAGESCLYINNMGEGRCFAGECDVVSQNCPNTADKCSYAFLADGGVGRTCGPAGATAEGAPCGPGDTCAKGLVCLGASANTMGTCAKFCYTDTGCGGNNRVCGSLVQIPNVTELPAVCVQLTTCDPLLQNCPAGQGCYLTTNGPACIPMGSATNGQTCGPSTLCVRGSTCLGPTTNMLSCRSFCNLDGGMPSCTGSACGGIANSMGQALPWGACQ